MASIFSVFLKKHFGKFSYFHKYAPPVPPRLSVPSLSSPPLSHPFQWPTAYTLHDAIKATSKYRSGKSTEGAEQIGVPCSQYTSLDATMTRQWRPVRSRGPMGNKLITRARRVMDVSGQARYFRVVGQSTAGIIRFLMTSIAGSVLSMVLLGERTSVGGWVGGSVGWLECVERKPWGSDAKACRLNYFLAFAARIGQKGEGKEEG